MNGMTGRKTINQASAMLVNTLDQMPGDANIRCVAPATRQYLDAGLIGHDRDMKHSWMPGQVRHDGYLDQMTS
jgi:hypothetical protein